MKYAFNYIAIVCCAACVLASCGRREPSEVTVQTSDTARTRAIAPSTPVIIHDTTVVIPKVDTIYKHSTVVVNKPTTVTRVASRSRRDSRRTRRTIAQQNTRGGIGTQSGAVIRDPGHPVGTVYNNGTTTSGTTTPSGTSTPRR